MPPSAISPRLLQSLNIIQSLSAQVILDLHIGERGRDVQDLLVGQLADFARRVDVETREEARGGVVADAEEGFEGFL